MAAISGDSQQGALSCVLHFAYDATWLAWFVLGSPWWLWRAASDASFRTMVRARLLGDGSAGLAPRAKDRKRVLIHCVSVGEVKGAQALVRGLERERPELELVLSTTTGNGLAMAQKLYPDLALVRFPFDLTPLARRFLERVDPCCVVLFELELWPSFLRECNRAGVPIAVVNGRITERSVERFRRVHFLRQQLQRPALWCVQDQSYAQRLRFLGVDGARIVITGNIKLDGLKTGAVEPRFELVRLLGLRRGTSVLVAGSTHAPEERWITEAWRASTPSARLILVPRHPERAAAIVGELTKLGVRVQRLTELRAGLAPDPSLPAIVDTIGELEQVYALADLVFVGGSLVAHGGQNLLEPAAQGRAVLHGPYMHNFVQEAALLEHAGASRVVATQTELGPAFAELLADAGLCERMGRAGQAAVEGQRGATELTLRALTQTCLDPLPARPASVSG